MLTSIRTYVRHLANDNSAKGRPVKKLSPRQQGILTFIEDFLGEHQYPPTVRDIQKGCDISSTSVVDYNLQILQREGHIKRRPDVSRGMELVGRAAGSGKDIVRVPMWGTIAAGQPIPVPSAESNEPLEMLELPRSITKDKRDVYALRVKGDSMIDALVDDGDVVVLEPVRQAENGDTVAAWIISREEATLKKFYLEGERVRLQPANSKMKPIYVDARDVEVHGRVIGVVRSI